jgi:tRNA(fMet)-specific endonuclease VapC
MKWLLDTCVVSDFVRGDTSTLARLKSTSPDRIALSVVTVMEIEFGLALDRVRARKIEAPLRALMTSVELLPYAVAEARATAALRAALRRRGNPIGPYDVQIAATALVHGHTLVTSNAREFARVQGLLLEDWRKP